jgi:hypothetical protein
MREFNSERNYERNFVDELGHSHHSKLMNLVCYAICRAISLWIDPVRFLERIANESRILPPGDYRKLIAVDVIWASAARRIFAILHDAIL